MPEKQFSFREQEVEQTAIQPLLEKTFAALVNDGHVNALFLLDKDGLILASCSESKTLGRQQSIESSALMLKLVHVFARKKISNANQVVFEDTDGKKLVFRFLPFFDTTVALIVQVPAQTSYRGLLNRLETLLKKLEKS